jgi:hypothetical protein
MPGSAVIRWPASTYRSGSNRPAVPDHSLERRREESEIQCRVTPAACDIPVGRTVRQWSISPPAPWRLPARGGAGAWSWMVSRCEEVMGRGALSSGLDRCSRCPPGGSLPPPGGLAIPQLAMSGRRPDYRSMVGAESIRSSRRDSFANQQFKWASGITGVKRSFETGCLWPQAAWKRPRIGRADPGPERAGPEPSPSWPKPPCLYQSQAYEGDELR